MNPDEQPKYEYIPIDAERLMRLLDVSVTTGKTVEELVQEAVEARITKRYARVLD